MMGFLFMIFWVKTCWSLRSWISEKKKKTLSGHVAEMKVVPSIYFLIQKPDDWLDDEPEYVADPNSVKPDDWDEEEDGEWEAPQIGETCCFNGMSLPLFVK